LFGGALQRRDFLTSSLAAAAVALSANESPAQAPASKAREYYELRKYQLQSPQTKLLQSYLADALIPALNRLGFSPIGVFNLDIGPETPAMYLLIPSPSVESLVTADLQLVKDEEFMKAAAPFWNAPASSPPFTRIESSLMIAFEGWPRLVVPPATAQHGKRVFQLRTYESPSNQDHVRKVEMFHNGEFEIFQRAGFWQVFFGDTLIGPRLPQLTYMVSFPDLAEMDPKWDAFRNDPEWKKLSALPRYSFEPTVSDVSNLVLRPATFSQI
jgi:NIPSNAP